MNVTLKPSATSILLIDIGAPFGGVETYLEALAYALRQDHRLFCVCGLPELARRLQAAGVHVVTIPVLKTRWSKILRFLGALFVVPYLVRRHGIKIVQVNGFLESLLMLPAKWLGCKTVRTAHGPTELGRYLWYKRPEMVLPRAAGVLSLRWADRIVCVSEAVRQDFLPFVPVRKLCVVANWVRRLPEPRGALAETATEVRLLYVGRLERYKGMFLLLEALRDLPAVHLTLVGHGSHEEEMELAAKGLNVTFAGFHIDPSRFYQEADVFVNPSLGPEGLPMANLEAMSFGLPCIFSDLPVHREISGEGSAAALFPSGNAMALRQCIAHIRGDRRGRVALGLRARAFIEERYSEEVARKGYQAAFHF